jgi:hypothetical membrane protein
MTRSTARITDAGADRLEAAGRTPRLLDRISGLAGMVGPVLFVLVFTAAAFLRPGYSALRDPVSDLGTGPSAWIQNANFFVFGLLILVFTTGFHRGMRGVMQPRRLKAVAVLLVLSGVGIMAAGVFPDNPNDPTAPAGIMHWLAGFLLAFLSAIAAISIVGKQLRKTSGWRGYGRYSTVTAWTALALIPVQFLLLSPSSPLAGAQLGGLLERIFAIEVFAWYAVSGWWIIAAGRQRETDPWVPLAGAIGAGRRGAQGGGEIGQDAKLRRAPANDRSR